MYPTLFAALIILCVAFVIVHQRLMRRLHRVETVFSLLEDTLRERLDLIAEWAEAQTEDDSGLLDGLRELCEASRDEETEILIKSYVKIERAARGLKLTGKPLKENEAKLRELSARYNSAIKPYNDMLGKFPWKLYAPMLMMKKEKGFR